MISAFLLNVIPVFGNCELFNHQIHTIATYKSDSPFGTFYTFTKSEDNKTMIKLASSEQKYLQSFKQKVVRVYLGKKSCTLRKNMLEKIRIVSWKDDPLSYSNSVGALELPLYGCEEIFSKIENFGYLGIVQDNSLARIYLPMKLNINLDIKLTDDEIYEITQDVKNRIDKKNLDYPKAISKRGVKGINITKKISIGNTTTPFRVAIGSVSLNDISPSGKKDISSDNKDIPFKIPTTYFTNTNNKNTPFKIPIIYFTNTKNKFYYFGGGAQGCGSENNGAHIASFLDVEGASDLTGNGYPDIISVNDIVYLILNNEDIMVIKGYSTC